MTALAAIDYERSLFSAPAGNWRDLRVPVGDNGHDRRDVFMTAWCNGAPGIGLARLSTLNQFDDVEVRREIDVALGTTIRNGFSDNHSLCHGDLGNVEFLLQAGQLLGDPQWPAHAYRHAANVVESVAHNEYACGTPSGVASPGLMTGMAGIGYELLRLADPERVPSVLMLEPPRL